MEMSRYGLCSGKCISPCIAKLCKHGREKKTLVKKTSAELHVSLYLWRAEVETFMESTVKPDADRHKGLLEVLH